MPVSTFELSLPEGKFSALAANKNLCQASLVMPTTFKAQNGAELKQSTHIEVQGCPNTLSVLAHKVKGRTLTVTVAVPQAGKLVASGSGLTQAHKNATARQTITLELTQRHAGKLNTNIQLRFTPNNSKQRKILHKTLHIKLH